MLQDEQELEVLKETRDSFIVINRIDKVLEEYKNIPFDSVKEIIKLIKNFKYGKARKILSKFPVSKKLELKIK